MLEAGIDRGTSCTGSIPDVTIKPRVPSAHPIRSIVAVNSRPGAHEAEEDVLGRSDHNSYMPVPNDEVAGLGVLNPLKSLDPVIEIVRTGVGIRKASTLVNRMHQMRAVVSGIAAHFRIKRS